MEFLTKIENKAQKICPHIVLAEGEDPRVANAAIQATNKGIAKVSVIAEPNIFSSLTENLPNAEKIAVHDPSSSPLLGEFTEHYHQLRKHRGVTPENANQVVRKILISPH